MPHLLDYISVAIGLLIFSSGIKHLQSPKLGNKLERVSNLLLLVFVVPNTVQAFESLQTASALQLLVFLSGTLGSVGAAMSLTSLAPLLSGASNRQTT